MPLFNILVGQRDAAAGPGHPRRPQSLSRVLFSQPFSGRNKRIRSEAGHIFAIHKKEIVIGTYIEKELKRLVNEELEAFNP